MKTNLLGQIIRYKQKLSEVTNQARKETETP